MLLNCYPNFENYPYKEFLSRFCNETVNELNQTLIRAQSLSVEPDLLKLFRLIKWMEGRLSDRVIAPKLNLRENGEGNEMLLETENASSSSENSYF